MSFDVKRVAMSTLNSCKRYQEYACRKATLGLTLDVSRMRFKDGFLKPMVAPLQRAFEAMDGLERGEIANADERGMVGHCCWSIWRRTAGPTPTEMSLQVR